MTRPSAVRPLLVAVLAVVHPGARVTAQAPVRPPGSSWIEAGGFYHPVSGNFGDWKGAYARAVISGVRNVWYLEAKTQEAFRDRGSSASISNVHTFSERIYTQVGVGGGTGAYVLPDLRVDASISLKLGRSKSVVTTVGATLVDAKANFTDKAIFGALAWYAGPSVLAEIGARFNSSNPGAVGSGRGTAVLMLGRVGHQVVTLRGGAGSEGYQLTGLGAPLRRFDSEDAGVSWRQWLGPRWGSVLGADWYHNPFYTRAGVTIGVFGAW